MSIVNYASPEYRFYDTDKKIMEDYDNRIGIYNTALGEYNTQAGDYQKLVDDFNTNQIEPWNANLAQWQQDRETYNAAIEKWNATDRTTPYESWSGTVTSPGNFESTAPVFEGGAAPVAPDDPGFAGSDVDAFIEESQARAQRRGAANATAQAVIGNTSGAFGSGAGEQLVRDGAGSAGFQAGDINLAGNAGLSSTAMGFEDGGIVSFGNGGEADKVREFGNLEYELEIAPFLDPVARYGFDPDKARVRRNPKDGSHYNISDDGIVIGDATGTSNLSEQAHEFRHRGLQSLLPEFLINVPTLKRELSPEKFNRLKNFFDVMQEQRLDKMRGEAGPYEHNRHEMFAEFFEKPYEYNRPAQFVAVPGEDPKSRDFMRVMNINPETREPYTDAEREEYAARTGTVIKKMLTKDTVEQQMDRLETSGQDEFRSYLAADPDTRTGDAIFEEALAVQEFAESRNSAVKNYYDGGAVMNGIGTLNEVARNMTRGPRGIGAYQQFADGGVVEAPATPEQLTSVRQKIMEDYGFDPVELALQENVDPELALRVAYQENKGRQGPVSEKGAIGLMQLMPGTAKELGVDPNDPKQNFIGGLRYLNQQLKEFGTVPLALAAYNAGPGKVRKYGGVPPFAETRKYVSLIHGAAEGEILPAMNGFFQMAEGEDPTSKPRGRPEGIGQPGYAPTPQEVSEYLMMNQEPEVAQAPAAPPMRPQARPEPPQETGIGQMFKEYAAYDYEQKLPSPFASGGEVSGPPPLRGPNPQGNFRL